MQDDAGLESWPSTGCLTVSGDSAPKGIQPFITRLSWQSSGWMGGSIKRHVRHVFEWLVLNDGILQADPPQRVPHSAMYHFSCQEIWYYRDMFGCVITNPPKRIPTHNDTHIIYTYIYTHHISIYTVCIYIYIPQFTQEFAPTALLGGQCWWTMVISGCLCCSPLRPSLFPGRCGHRCSVHRHGPLGSRRKTPLGVELGVPKS